MLAEQPGEEARIVIADFIADGLDALAAAGEQALGGFDPQPLQVMQRFVTGGGLEAAHEIADAHAMFPGNILEAEFIGEVLFEPLLDLQDDHVLVQFLPAEADPPWRIAALHFIQDIPRHGLGDVGATEAFNEVNVEIAG
ncbi:hypothetical protein D3C78_1340690 [compost metagenome]